MKLNEKQLRQLIKKEILNETFSPMQSIAPKSDINVLLEDLQATTDDFEKKMSDFLSAMDDPTKAASMLDDVKSMLDKLGQEIKDTATKKESYKKKKLDEVDPAGVQRATGLYASETQMNKIKSLMGVLFEETAREAMEDGADEQLAEELALAVLLEAAADGLESLGFLAEANAIRQMQEM